MLSITIPTAIPTTAITLPPREYLPLILIILVRGRGFGRRQGGRYAAVAELVVAVGAVRHVLDHAVDAVGVVVCIGVVVWKKVDGEGWFDLFKRSMCQSVLIVIPKLFLVSWFSLYMSFIVTILFVVIMTLWKFTVELNVVGSEE